MTAIEVKEKQTGIIKLAVYAPNKKGNKQYCIDGKFYNDKDFDKLFKIEKDEPIN